MNKLLLAAIAGCLVVGGAFASPVNVTIKDGLYANGSGVNVAGEDQEFDKGSFSQLCDYEGFFWDGSNLSLVGGLDFKNGAHVDGQYVTAGDIFLDLNSDGKFDRAVKYDFNNSTFALYDFNTATLTPSDYAKADPFSVASGNILATGILSLQSNLTDAQTGFLGGNHYKVTVDLAQVGITGNFTAHATMSCGNDVIKGKVVPEPTLVSLLGIGLLSLGLVARRKKNV